MTAALVNPAILAWARERAATSPAVVAHQIHVKEQLVAEWETGGKKPTFKQAQALARVLHVPFGYLFLNEPPEEKLPIPDLRTHDDRPRLAPSPDLRDVIADIVRKQQWYRECLIEQGHSPLPFIGRFAGRPEVDAVAADMSSTLQLSLADRTKLPNWEEALDVFMDHSEKAGVTVMRSGIVGSNTHRRLAVEEFRGLVISDTVAPVVFLNGVDAPAAQIFTLAHELAHLWLGESGVTDAGVVPIERPTYSSVESLCNAIAAQMLVPEDDLLRQWKPRQSFSDNAENLARVYKVSSIVVARRALDLGLGGRDEFRAFYALQSARWQRAKEDREGGGNFYATVPVRNGRKLTAAVLRAALAEDMLLRDAGALLAVHPMKLARLAAEMGLS